MKTLSEYLKLPYPMEIVEDQEEGGIHDIFSGSARLCYLWGKP